MNVGAQTMIRVGTETLGMLYKVRVRSSKDGQPLELIAEGALIPGVPLILLMLDARIVPPEVIEQFQTFRLEEHDGGTFNARDGSITYQFEALRVEAFRGVTEGTNWHNLEIDQVESVHDTLFALRIRVSQRHDKYIELFLGLSE